MGFSFDSHLILSAVLLFAIAALAWGLSTGCRAGIRLNLRFGAVLFAALAVEGFAASLTPSFLGVAFAIALLVMPLTSTALTLSLFAPRPAPPLLASVALVTSLVAGLAAALMDMPLLALTMQALAVSAMVLLGCARFAEARLQAVETIAGSLALLGGGMALLQGAMAAALSLFAAGLLGLACALQLRVEQQADALAGNTIGRPRP